MFGLSLLAIERLCMSLIALFLCLPLTNKGSHLAYTLIYDTGVKVKISHKETPNFGNKMSLVEQSELIKNKKGH